MKTKQNKSTPNRRTQGMNWIRKEKRLSIYLRDGLACAYCGLTIEDGAKFTLDHLTPYSAGGKNVETNLVTCCHKCNSSRQDRPWREFSASVAGYVNVSSGEIIQHITRIRRRKLDTNMAKKIIARRANWTQIVANNFS